jgi:iron complex transport system substrate-binding protein
LAGTGFLHSEEAQQRISTGKLAEVATSDGLLIDTEKLITLQPQAVFTYGGFDGGRGDTYTKLAELQMPVVLAQETVEATPLGQAEWIKFFAAFLGKERQADSIFNHIESRYKQLSQQTATVAHKPWVLLNAPYQSVWYMPAGEHFTTQLVADAGGKSVFDHLEGKGSIPLTIEKVYAQAQKAEIWLNPSDFTHLEQLEHIDKRLAALPVFAQKQVWNCTKRQKPNSGNDIFEQGVLRPDLILEDLIRILHPQLLPPKDLYFYESLAPKSN